MPIRIPQPAWKSPSQYLMLSSQGTKDSLSTFKVKSPSSQPALPEEAFLGLLPDPQHYNEEAKKDIRNFLGKRGSQLEPRGGHSSTRLTCTSGHGLLFGGDWLRESPVPSSDRLRCLTTMQHLTGKPLEERKASSGRLVGSKKIWQDAPMSI